MGKFAQGKKPIEVVAVAGAVTTKLAGQYASIRYRSDNARTTLMIAARNMNSRDRRTADAMGENIVNWMKDRENTKDLRCDVDVHIQGSESVNVAYRTGIVDYSLYVQSDGDWSFHRIKAA